MAVRSKSTRVQGIYAWLGRGQAIFATASGVVAATNKATPQDVVDHFGKAGPAVGAILEFCQAWLWAISPGLLLLVLLLGWLKTRYGDPIIWKELQTFTNDVRKDIFGSQDGCYQHHYRVTLYKYRAWTWTRDVSYAWLVPVVRSGHTSQSRIRDFSVDRKRAGGAKGIAGQAWESDGSIHIQELPDLSADDSPAAQARYAKLTNVAVEELQAKPSYSQSFWAVRVEAKGEPWGVLVVDTVAPTVSKKKAEQAFNTRAKFLSLLLQRA